ncbi:LytR/AlgR family response regulator transcription factor [Inmirania thermothiophila]|uniref:LytTR family two component transcriptional regulator n=1 Tax=Inmirania thermothiophila TaxID=1750597 RepID=A0A3N1Y796_9GAMM|nr:response regulator transcription factor [Inmirania thermothiophila]ROR34398.1 LytTR family two component transcriptional regulator [Inmirania thermothiophila]
MRILIVDDEAPARERLRRLCGEIPGCAVVAEAADGRTAIRRVGEHDPDVVLMDIRMPGMDGLEAARHLALLPAPPAVIFVTAYGDHALAAFEAQAVDYLLKPIRRERLAAALARAQRPTRAQTTALAAAAAPARTHLAARVRGDLVLVPVAEVRLLRADHKYTEVVHPGGTLLLEESLKSLERELGEAFLRVHRAALVGIAHVRALHAGPGGLHLRLDGLEEPVPVSRRHAAAVRRRLKALTAGRQAQQ